MVRISKSVKAIKPVKNAPKKATRKVIQAHSPSHTPKLDRYCTDCKHEFRRPTEFVRHRTQTLRHNPDGARSFVCHICNKAFTQACNLENHIRRHLGDFVTCTLPMNRDHTEICQKTFTDRNNLRAHIKRHLAKFNPVPAWLEDAAEQCLDRIRAKPKLQNSVERSIRESLSPFDSPLATPPPEPDHFVHVFDAETMQSLRPVPLTTRNQVATSQPGEFDLDLLNPLGASLPSSKGTPNSEYPSIASAQPDVAQPISTLNSDMNFAASIPQHYEYPGTLPQEILLRAGPATYLGLPQAFSEATYPSCSYADPGAFTLLPDDRSIFDSNNLSIAYPAFGNMEQGHSSLYDKTYPRFNGSNAWGQLPCNDWTGYTSAFGTSVYNL